METKEMLVHRVRLVPQVLRAILVLRAIQVPKVTLVHKDYKEIQEPLVVTDLMEIKDKKVVTVLIVR
jgi:hypothetical protein